jgi:ABC-2 type transport system permease protein
MRKLFAVFKREYLQTVRKKSFIILTLLMPFLMAAVVAIPSLLIAKSFGEKRVAVLDGTGRLQEAFAPAKVAAAAADGAGRQARQMAGAGSGPAALVRPEYASISGDPKAAAAPFLARLTGRNLPENRKLDGVLLIPADAPTNPAARLTYYSRSATDLIGQQLVSEIASRALTHLRLTDRGVDPALIEDVLRRTSVDAVQVSSTGEQRKGGEANFLVGFVFAALLFLPMIIYGVEIMRGIVQEKTERIAEILISSMSALQLLGGKILGLAAVGLTQISVWMAMGGLVVGAASGIALASGMNLGQLLRPSIVPWFVVFYLLGYLIYVCVYAVGGAMANSEKEAQQATMPAMIVIMLPWFLLAPIIMSPDSKLATTLSLIPLFTPITMFVRVLVSDPPTWQVGLSIALTALTTYCLFWAAAKIFRVGILSYGKRPTIPELWRWLKVA